MEVDLILLSRDLSPPREDVWQGIQIQEDVDVRIHRLEGTPRPEDPNRYETIARARNNAKTLGTSPWVMFLDDDVVLGASCLQRLVHGLAQKNRFAALGADSAGEMASELENWDYPRHVGMAATLFRREALERLTFRWEPGKCECRCCCLDLRRAGLGIGYLAAAKAWHRPSRASVDRRTKPAMSTGLSQASTEMHASGPGARVLTAFDRNHFLRFRRQFLTTLRSSGNREPLTAVTYGLLPSERSVLEAAGVEVVARHANGVASALRRLKDFQDVVERWPVETPVAYWDAGDVLFQGSLLPLWELVRADPDRLLVVREPVGIGESPVIVPWTNHIENPGVRRESRQLLSSMPFFNAGFAAGTVGSLMGYLREGDRLLKTDLKGVLHWGDQVAMGHYLHRYPDAWREIADGWNYCIIFRKKGTYRISAGRVESLDGAPVHVVHGNGRTLAPWVMAFAS
jgi:hypothetical protein